MATTATAVGAERADLLAMLAKHRHFLRFTTRDLTDDQAGQRTTVSELTLGGLIKHLTNVERNWTNFIVEGPSAMGDFGARTEDDLARWAGQFRLLPGETLDGVLAGYARVAERTDELVRTLPDLNATHPLPRAPWHPAGGQWSARSGLAVRSVTVICHPPSDPVMRRTLRPIAVSFVPK